MSLENLFQPTTLEDAVSLLGVHGGDAKLLAGGTALTIMLNQGLIAPRTLIGLSRVADRGFGSIDVIDGSLRIGAGVTLTRIARSQVVRAQAPGLAAACAVVGNQRVRNIATLSGNLAEADYASDPPAMLVSLGASVEILGVEGRRTLLVSDLITGFYSTALEPTELITAIYVPVKPGLRSRYEKFRTRSSEDRPCVGVAVAASFESGLLTALEVTVGAVAGTPQRDESLSARTSGLALSTELASTIAHDYRERIEPMADVRGSSRYRRDLIEVLVRRSLAALVESADDDSESMQG